jgi:micrococcal nuclease
MRKEETEELRFSARASKPMKRNRNNSVLFFFIHHWTFDVRCWTFIFICAMTYLICLIILFSPAHTLAMEMHHVKRVVDGDTLLLDNNRFVRYIGINAPEVQHGNKNAEPFGTEAKRHNGRLLGNREIYLVYGQEKSDRYGRGLGYVYTHKKIFVNRMMLEQGWAYCLFKPPNIRYHDVFLKAQRLAMQGQQGMWREWVVQALNIVANKRSRRFHRKGCPFGMQTGKSNRIIFSSLWEAFWEGYAPCKRCFPEGAFAVHAD